MPVSFPTNVPYPASWWRPGRLIVALKLVTRRVPTTRSRAKLDGRPGELAAQYYAQRASMGLQITEGTQPSEEGQGFADSYRRATTYVDDILRGAKLADLPVQAVDKYYLVINLATAKTLELTIPPTLLAVADDIVE